ncbi:C2 domain protein [Necator americanus]|uniref:C2 domain protein n=1 Tax=Necator americanus TaxID=51031 RepID=W2TMT4_NECAM|nr:C2 domain protein [Necator americanus]ETN82297.1 C2 domain protein [Necator americanus]
MDDRSVLHYELGFYEKSGDNCYRGTLTFALRYDFIHRVLMLHVLRANHLPVEEKGRTVDPYVKMYLLPERRNHCKTRICKKTLDPDFNEMFSFDVAFNSLSGRMLQFTVYDFDRFTRHGLIGNVIMRDLFDKSDLYTWTEYTMQIVGSQEKNDFGDLLLYLMYSPNEQKLFVTVAKAYNLRPMDITGASDPYVKVEQVYRGKRVKLRKSTCKRANLNPVYHETLEYDLPMNQVAETNFLVQVMDWDRIGKDDLLGCCVLGKDSPTVEGRTQWENCFLALSHTDVNGQAALKAEANREGGVLRLEAMILRRMAGKPHVAQLLQSGKKELYSYIVMTLLGESLDEIFRQINKVCTVSTQVRIGINILFGIKQIHDVGFIHRDLKPANVALGHKSSAESRFLHIFDFGLAREFIVTDADGRTKMRRPRPCVHFRYANRRYTSV